ncbi:hypothetical protein ABN357_20670 [Providencia rettgeri]|uniref:hypothetical protein n=1 Tax=Enterobacterales TaxID=91347 RepID=UPI0023FA3517|nr:hypothetical protein [Proteus mirabilis]MDF7318699.1 hypothetical protein [Proteus mirabilis]
MAKYQIDSIQEWDAFHYDGNEYSLSHLDVHEIEFKGEKYSYKFVVTYGLHCFAKEDTQHNIPVTYKDGREEKPVCMERYEASKHIKGILENLPNISLYQTTTEKYFTLNMLNTASGQMEPYKVCIAFYKEKRLLRMHVLSAFFARSGPGAIGEDIPNKSMSIFKIAKDTKDKPRNSNIPKEAKNR